MEIVRVIDPGDANGLVLGEAVQRRGALALSIIRVERR